MTAPFPASTAPLASATVVSPTTTTAVALFDVSELFRVSLTGSLPMPAAIARCRSFAIPRRRRRSSMDALLGSGIVSGHR